MDNSLKKKQEMSSKTDKTLKEEFENVANKYRYKLVDMYFADEEGVRPDSLWIGGESGGMLEVNDYFFGFDDIRYIVDNNLPYDVFVSWYDYCLTVGGLNINTPNLKSWHHGCPRLNDEQIANIIKIKQNFENACNEANKFAKGGF